MKGVVKAIMGDVREELFNAEEKRGWLYGGW
jgi:hypothetical protein